MPQYGSLINSLASSSREPEIGDGVTFLHWTDRDPGTVTDVRRFKTGQRAGQISQIAVKADGWTIVGGNEGDGSARYEYSRDDSAPTVWYRRNNRGRWCQMHHPDQQLIVGVRERYSDPSF